MTDDTYKRKCMNVIVWMFLFCVIIIEEMSVYIFFHDFQDGNNYAIEIRNDIY